MKIQERYNGITRWFSEHVPDPATELRYRDPYGLLVAVILSAQCTDKRINMVTPLLLERFPTPADLAAASEQEIFGYIKSVSYPNSKAANLKAMARTLIDEFGGVVPDNVQDLMKLKGVGRKTANVVVSVVYGQPAMAVDTHVFRVSARTGLTRGAKNPRQAEDQLVGHFPREILGRAHHWLILHGRYVCTARAPKCDICGISRWCKYYETKVRQEAAKESGDEPSTAKK